MSDSEFDYDLFDVLANNERVIVHSDAGEGYIITWNQSDTLQLWFTKNGMWMQQDMLTQSGYGPKTFAQAKRVAFMWVNGALHTTEGFVSTI